MSLILPAPYGVISARLEWEIKSADKQTKVLGNLNIIEGPLGCLGFLAIDVQRDKRQIEKCARLVIKVMCYDLADVFPY